MQGRAGVGAEVMGAGGMEVSGMGVSGIKATGGQAHELGLASASDRSGGRIGGRTGDLILTPMAMRTRPSSLCHPPSSMCNPQHRPLPSLLPRRTGTIVTRPKPITPMSSSAQGDGGQSPPRRHKPEAAGPRARHPTRVSSVPRGDRGI
jgi:hypothetical protein